MACIKSVNRSATVAMAPDAPYMAAGTMAGAVDLSFSSSASLEIFKLDFQSDDQDLPVVGESQSSERFNRIAWGKNGSESDGFSLGLIAGGLVDGNIDIWNPLSLIRKDSSENALVGQLSNHRGPVRGLEFNPFTPNLLASGADDGEICIWDLSKPSEPTHFPPLKGIGSDAQGEISYVSWNNKVQHILASTSHNGLTVVWDLRRQKQVISVQDSIRRRCSVLQWHPDATTQLIVASDEDSSPVLRLWDMRQALSPVKEFVGHTKGVIAMSWCPNDSSYLLTCGKDNRTICWNTITGEIVCELPSGTNWNFDVHWYPKIPSVISASSFDGKIGLYNIEACSRCDAGESVFGTATLKAPKWYRRPAGVSFGFGGKLLSFHPTSPPLSGSEVLLQNLVTEHTLVSRSSEFEAAIQNGEKSLLKTLCDKKSQESDISEDDRKTWAFLKVLFEEDGTARSKMLAHLGFSAPIEGKVSEPDVLAQELNSVTLDDTLSENVGFENSKVATFAADDGIDFFNNLPSPKTDVTTSLSSVDKTVLGNSILGEEVQEEPELVEESGDVSFNDSIQSALVVGDYKGAVAQCISANKMADALVIAHVGGSSLWETTRDQYLNSSRSPYLKIVSAMVNKDLLSLVDSRPLKYWKETLALLCTFAQNEEWSMLCNSLASKLMSAGNTLAATLCFICAANIDKTVEIWSRSLTADCDGKSYVDILQDLMEKTIVLALATGQKQFSASLCKLVEKYAEILASQGLLLTAMEYLKLLGSDELTPELTILRDRIALSTEPENDTNTSVSMTDNSQYYYHEQAPQHVAQGVPGSPYGDNYNQASSYGGGYAAPSPYQPSMQPSPYQQSSQNQMLVPSQQPPQAQAPPRQLFVPSAPTQPSQENFAPSHFVPQQPVQTFVPSNNAPVLRNAEQYQQPQPSTLASQLYPGSSPGFHPVQPLSSQGPVTGQVGTMPGHNMPHVVAPNAAPGFRHVNNSGVQRPGMSSMQAPSPTQLASSQPAVAPAAPPPTVQTVDTSNVPAHHKPVIATLTRLFNETSEAMGGPRANPAKRREIEDNSRKLGALFAKLNSGDVSKNASDKLVDLCRALDKNDFSTALQIQVLLTTSEWDECNFWLTTLKRMIKTRQTAR